MAENRHKAAGYPVDGVTATLANHGSAMTTDITEIENKLWAAADELRANSRLKASEYSIPVLGLIFLRFADRRFTDAEEQLAGKTSGRRKIGKDDYKAEGVLIQAVES